jgi:hypothetical protein
VILSIQKSRIINQAEINALFVKANRFLSKDSIKKEKIGIKNEVKANFITNNGAMEYARDGQLADSSFDDDWEDDYPP